MNGHDISNLLLSLTFGLTAGITVFGVMLILFARDLFAKIWSKVTKPLGISLVVGYSILAMAAVTQVDLASQVKGLLAVANGGTNIASGTSGGVLAYTGTGVLASSAALASNALVTGGGAGVVPLTKSWADMTPTDYVIGGGTAQAQTATLAPAATALTNGMVVAWLPVANNTTSGPTIAVNGLTAKPITKLGATALVANDIKTTAIAIAIYDGTQFELQNPQVAPTATVPNDFQEVPTGTINGSNVTFTLANTPASSTNVNCFLNGLNQRQGGADYSITGPTITYGVAPPTGATLNCIYF